MPQPFGFRVGTKVAARRYIPVPVLLIPLPEHRYHEGPSLDEDQAGPLLVWPRAPASGAAAAPSVELKKTEAREKGAMVMLSRTFTLSVDGRPTLAFSAQTLKEAQELCKEAWLRDDLHSLTSGAQPLCGTSSKLTVRTASEEEQSTYDEGAEATPATDDLVLIYLVEIDNVADGVA